MQELFSAFANVGVSFSIPVFLVCVSATFMCKLTQMYAYSFDNQRVGEVCRVTEGLTAVSVEVMVCRYSKTFSLVSRHRCFDEPSIIIHAVEETFPLVL